MPEVRRTGENWVTLRTFNWLSDAQVLRTLLESEGIETFIPEENTAGIMSPLFTAMQIRLQVREKDLEQSRETIEGSHEATENSPSGTLNQAPSPSSPCKTCGSEDSSKRTATRSHWFHAAIGFLFGVPMRGRSPKACPNCGSKN